MSEVEAMNSTIFHARHCPASIAIAPLLPPQVFSTNPGSSPIRFCLYFLVTAMRIIIRAGARD